MGGMQALEWAVAYPGSRASPRSRSPRTARHSAQQIAFNEVGRQAIMADPGLERGQLLRQEAAGARARRGAHGRPHHLHERRVHAREVRPPPARQGEFGFDFDVDFEVESYLRYRGSQFVDRFDANSYLYITKAMDYFDLTNGSGSLADAFENGQRALPGDQLHVRLAVSQLSVAGDRERAAQPQLRRRLLRSAVQLRARRVSGGCGGADRIWSADFWRARYREGA